MPETQIEIEGDYSDWIAVGGGNYTSGEALLADGYNQSQVDYLCSLPVESCVIGMIINANQESSLGVHIDTHPDNYGAYADDVQRYLAEMLALG
jgi:hypothetical protein